MVEKIYIVTARNVPVRLGPHKNANIKGRLEEGDRVAASGKEGEYIVIEEVESDGVRDLVYRGCAVHKAWLRCSYKGGENG